jgi:hypothetical protein
VPAGDGLPEVVAASDDGAGLRVFEHAGKMFAKYANHALAGEWFGENVVHACGGLLDGDCEKVSCLLSD